ncbi:MAG: ATP synthase F1 subunit epsilon [Acidobacteria bacterium]|nr:ATP synthase F1 subunit epsilon [Acidobacteriota bacterium]
MLQVEVVSPEAIRYSGEATMVVARTVEGGDIAFQTGHVPFLGVLQIHQAKVIRPDGEDRFALHRGFIEVTGERVTILSDMAEAADEIDVARAEAAKQRAVDALAADESDPVAAQALERANIRLAVASA